MQKQHVISPLHDKIVIKTGLKLDKRTKCFNFLLSVLFCLGLTERDDYDFGSPTYFSRDSSIIYSWITDAWTLETASTDIDKYLFHIDLLGKISILPWWKCSKQKTRHASAELKVSTKIEKTITRYIYLLHEEHKCYFEDFK